MDGLQREEKEEEEEAYWKAGAMPKRSASQMNKRTADRVQPQMTGVGGTTMNRRHPNFMHTANCTHTADCIE
jgi:hypothetical protein